MCTAIEDMKIEAITGEHENSIIEHVESLMETTSWSAERAMDALKLSVADRQVYYESKKKDQ